jgi:hypothetical protein
MINAAAGNKYDVKEDDEFSSELDLVHRAQHIMRPFVLRRRKADVCGKPSVLCLSFFLARHCH